MPLRNPASATSLAPGLLLAAPALGDANFERSVVLLGHHDEEGALGWVLNGRTVGRVREVLEQADLVPGGVVLPLGGDYAEAVRIGGPVEPGMAWLLCRKHSGAPVFSGEVAIAGDYTLTGSREVVEAVARGAGPERFRLLLGYAGWGAGQLEGEIAQGAWLPAPLDLELLFDQDPDDLWDAAYRATMGVHAFSFGSRNKGSA